MYCTYDKNTKKCLSVGTGTNTKFYQSIGMTDEEVEQDYNGEFWLKGFAPNKPQSEIDKETKRAELSDNEKRLNEIKDELLTAFLLDDNEYKEELKTEYKELMYGEI